MQLFQKTTSSSLDPQTLAGSVLETIPLVMNLVRTSMRANRSPELSIPQFRTLALLYHHPDISLSEIAEHVGTTLPSASKLVDALVLRMLLTRTESRTDRRKKNIRITAAGRECFGETRERAREALAQRLSSLPPAQAAVVRRAMEMLRTHLAPACCNGAPTEKSL
jgi:DNA-binding MarR family transcriptional regulator